MDITETVFLQRDRALQLGDHDSYREHLSRQLATLRKKLGRSTPKNGKFAKADAVTAEDVAKNSDHAKLLLYSAERAWALAMSIKHARLEERNSGHLTGSARSHIISRLHKATQYAQELVAALNAEDASTDWLEAKAYYSTLVGAQEFEQHAAGPRSDDVGQQRTRLERCLRNFAAARQVYASLLKSKKKEVFKEVIASTIDPSIRFASYQAHIPRTAAIIAISQRFFPRNKVDLVKAIERIDPSALEENKQGGQGADASIPNTITWRNRKANIVDASIGQALAAASTAQERLEASAKEEKIKPSSQERANAYDEILTAYQDAADATRHALEDHEREGISESDPRMQDLRVTHLAVNHDMIGWRIGRDRVLTGADDGLELQAAPLSRRKKANKEDGPVPQAKNEGSGRKLARLRERVALYDAILQSIDSIGNLPGAAEASFRKELQGKRDYFRALKCLNIAYSHAILSNSKNALALLLHASELSSKALETTYTQRQSNTISSFEISQDSLQALNTKLRSLTTHYRALVELQNLHDNSVIAAKKGMTSTAPIVDRLNDYPAAGVDLKNLVTYPPKLKPVPVKPLFYDIAWNYIEYPGRETQAIPPQAKAVPAAAKAEPQSTEKEQKKGGWGGWFGR